MERTPFETFGNIASVLGVLGGLATKRPLMAGLNASAAAMKAIKESDAGAFRQNFETWKAQSDYAYKLADFQNQQYRDVLTLRFFEDRSYNEMSDILQMPVGTISTLLYRAKRALHAELPNNFLP